MARNPAARAERAHCRAASTLGAKIAGPSVPSPGPRSVKVLTPKCRNSASSARCQAGWEGDGTGTGACGRRHGITPAAAPGTKLRLCMLVTPQSVILAFAQVPTDVTDEEPVGRRQ